MSFLRSLCLLAYSGVQHILYCIFVFLPLVYSMLPVSLDCHFWLPLRCSLAFINAQHFYWSACTTPEKSAFADSTLPLFPLSFNFFLKCYLIFFIWLIAKEENVDIRNYAWLNMTGGNDDGRPYDKTQYMLHEPLLLKTSKHIDDHSRNWLPLFGVRTKCMFWC
jgi:hypothetical protein